MTRVTVWAPRAESVALDVGDHLVATTPEPSRPGWWTSVDDLAHGTDYLVVVDGERFPDPLARWAPHGVHAESRVLDTSAFSWRDEVWTGARLDSRSLVYELHVGTFTPEGTLAAAAQRLAYLADLGVSHVELMPLAAFEGDRGWGYDGVLIAAVHEAYGGPLGLVEFVDMAHRTGIAVILDVVHNHLGPSGNYWDRFGPFFTDRHHTPWGSAVNLDAPGSDDVRRILIDSARGWLRDYHLDGLRLDAVHELHDSRATPFLEELAAEVDDLQRELGRPLTLIAESDRNDPRTVTPPEHGGTGMTAQWDDDVHHALHWVLTGETDGYYGDFGSCEAAAHAMERTFLHDGRWSSFRGRTHGRPVDPADTPPERFVASLQTHDQVGNRATGDRLSQQVSPDRAAAGAALLFALPYVPMLFMGEEFFAQTPWCFFSGFEDAALGGAVTEGRRREFASHGWAGDDVPDPQDPGTFDRSVLDWSELGSRDGARMRSWYARLAGLRRLRDTQPQAAAGRPQVSWEAGADGRPLWWAVVDRGHLTFVALGAGTPVALALDTEPGQKLSLLAGWSSTSRIVGDAVEGPPVVVTLEPGDSVVLGGVAAVSAVALADLRDIVDTRVLSPDSRRAATTGG